MNPTYENTGQIAHGNFGKVFRIIMNNQEYAMKKVEQNEDFINRENEIIQTLSHPNIVKYIQSWTENNYLYLVMGCMPSTIREYCFSHSFDKDELKTVTKHMFSGLEYLHSLSICHRDIKPDNLLFDPETFNVQICDFGCSKYIKNNQPNAPYICARYYRAPELLLGAKLYTTSIDMWSMACVISEIVTKSVLFRGFESTNVQLSEIMRLLGQPTHLDYIKMNVRNYRLRGKKSIHLLELLYDKTSLELIQLLSKILVYDPTKRLTASQALSEPYFSSVDILEHYISLVQEDIENNQLENIEKRMRELHNFMNNKLKSELELQEELHNQQCKTLIESPIEKGNKKWSSPMAGVFTRNHKSHINFS